METINILLVVLVTTALFGCCLSQAIFDDLMENYDKLQSPHKDRSTNVQIGIYINSFYAINEQTMDYTLNLYLRRSWVDPRLKFTPRDGKDMIKLPHSALEKIWTPDTFFRNEKSGKWHDITVPNVLLRLYSDGKIWYAVKLTVTLSCAMRLQKFPFDTQTCPVLIESFGHTMDTYQMVWMDKPVSKDESLQFPQFSLVRIDHLDCSQNYTTGAYPCLQINFQLRRDYGYYILQVFIPSIMLVILSWFAFWLKPDGVTARVLIGLFTVLTMTTQSTGVRTALPKVSYIKAIDLWMMMCLLFVFFAMIESALVAFLSTVKSQSDSGNDIQLSELKDGKQEQQSDDSRQRLKIAKKIDFFSRILFPVLFLLFVIIYFAVY
ncbi:glycine receptor subunit alpha-2-like [Tubulanus polymorphus]|uniref:glycine receptor subunit alpha-2-like n=1 Tax=Tubulanus polymorphus TaxID=672921 RepID=UPI003DA4817E